MCPTRICLSRKRANCDSTTKSTTTGGSSALRRRMDYAVRTSLRKNLPIISKGAAKMQAVSESIRFDLYVRGEILFSLSGSLVTTASRRDKDRTAFSRWHDSQADLIRFDLIPGKP